MNYIKLDKSAYKKVEAHCSPSQINQILLISLVYSSVKEELSSKPKAIISIPKPAKNMNEPTKYFHIKYVYVYVAYEA